MACPLSQPSFPPGTERYSVLKMSRCRAASSHHAYRQEMAVLGLAPPLAVSRRVGWQWRSSHRQGSSRSLLSTITSAPVFWGRRIDKHNETYLIVSIVLPLLRVLTKSCKKNGELSSIELIYVPHQISRMVLNWMFTCCDYKGRYTHLYGSIL